MLRVVRTGACVLLAAFLAALVFGATRVPIPPDADPLDVLDLSLHTLIAEADFHGLFGEEDRITGARTLVQLDPDLTHAGDSAAAWLAQQSPDPTERLAYAHKLGLPDTAPAPQIHVAVLAEPSPPPATSPVPPPQPVPPCG